MDNSTTSIRRPYNIGDSGYYYLNCRQPCIDATRNPEGQLIPGKADATRNPEVPIGTRYHTQRCIDATRNPEGQLVPGKRRRHEKPGRTTDTR